ncbi:MAG: hypothetical protein ACTSRT_11465 [Promethearchaeota archaeon]
MNKKVIFSARHNHVVIKQVIELLKTNSEVDFTFHDPTKQFFNLSRMPKAFKEADLFIVKVRNDCSVDLLHFARINLCFKKSLFPKQIEIRKIFISSILESKCEKIRAL